MTLRRGIDHRALDAPAGHGADEVPGLIDREVATFGARRRPPGTDYRGERRGLARRAPLAHGLEQGIII
jgi:hypothetical protein